MKWHIIVLHFAGGIRRLELFTQPSDRSKSSQVPPGVMEAKTQMLHVAQNGPGATRKQSTQHIADLRNSVVFNDELASPEEL